MTQVNRIDMRVSTGADTLCLTLVCSEAQEYASLLYYYKQRPDVRFIEVNDRVHHNHVSYSRKGEEWFRSVHA